MQKLYASILLTIRVYSPWKLLANTLSAFNWPLNCWNTISTFPEKVFHWHILYPLKLWHLNSYPSGHVILSLSSVDAGVISNAIIYPSSVTKTCTLYPKYVFWRTISIISATVTKSFVAACSTKFTYCKRKTVNTAIGTDRPRKKWFFS